MTKKSILLTSNSLNLKESTMQAIAIALISGFSIGAIFTLILSERSHKHDVIICQGDIILDQKSPYTIGYRDCNANDVNGRVVRVVEIN